MSPHSRFFSILLILFLALGLSACGSLFGPGPTSTPVEPSPTPQPPTATPPPAAAIVNGEIITLAEFQAEVQRYLDAQKELGKTTTEEQARQIVLDDLIAQVLLAQAARAAGFELTESALQSRVDVLVTRLGGAEALSQWQSAHGYDDASFRVALKRAAEAAWMRDQIIASVPATAEQVHLQQILVYNEETARQMLEQLKNGADFNELATRADPTTRGELGWLPRGYLLDPQIEQAAFSLQPGQFSEVIATPAGFHILRVLEREANHPLSPDALLTLQEKALQDWLNQQRAQSQIILTP